MLGVLRSPIDHRGSPERLLESAASIKQIVVFGNRATIIRSLSFASLGFPRFAFIVHPIVKLPRVAT